MRWSKTFSILLWVLVGLSAWADWVSFMTRDKRYYVEFPVRYTTLEEKKCVIATCYTPAGTCNFDLRPGMGQGESVQHALARFTQDAKGRDFKVKDITLGRFRGIEAIGGYDRSGTTIQRTYVVGEDFLQLTASGKNGITPELQAFLDSLKLKP